MESWVVAADGAKGNLVTEDRDPPSFILSRAYLLIVCIVSSFAGLGHTNS